MLVYELRSRASYEIKKGDIIPIAGNSIGSRKHATALLTLNLMEQFVLMDLEFCHS